MTRSIIVVAHRRCLSQLKTQKHCCVSENRHSIEYLMEGLAKQRTSTPHHSGWVVRISRRTGKQYFFNTETNESTYDPKVLQCIQ